ncbi:MAG TPA: tRNA pseudouridine(38-40) synthase TruA [Actinobacteria bacterium]|nr:tRNA pseudouridine(38-40) synthase TruA [Actinomycetota bacterium]
MATYRIDLAYDGSDFRGYAVQPNVRTVQGALEAQLSLHIPDIVTIVAGRTDAGVHATGQVVSFSTDHPIMPDKIMRSLNKRLAPSIAVLSFEQVADSFHARFDAVGRVYRYQILDRPYPDPFLAGRVWNLHHDLDVEKMHRVAQQFVGTHDFASFCRAAPGRSTIRTVKVASWHKEGELTVFRVEASSFCHQMVRSLVALSVDVGRGKLHEDDVPAIVEAKDRRGGNGAAPARGLTLVRVDY